MFNLCHHSATEYSLWFNDLLVVRFTRSGKVGRLGEQVTERFRTVDLLRWGVPSALAPQGHVMLHASSVVGRSGCIAILGTSGAGKSTTARVLESLDWTMLADDLLVCDERGRLNSSGEQQISCWCEEIAGRLDEEPEIPFRDLARLLAAEENQHWIDLDYLLFLSEQRTESGDLSLAPLIPATAFQQLVLHGFGGLPAPAAWEHQFQAYASLAERAAAAEMQAPGGLDFLKGALEGFEKQLAALRRRGPSSVMPAPR